MGVWGGWPCTAVTPTCTDKEAGSNGVGFSMDTRLVGPKGMNGLKKLSSTRLLAQTNLPTRHQPSCRLRHRSDTRLGSSPTHPHPRQPTLRAAGTLQGVVPSCCGRRVAVWSGVCSNRPSRAGKRHDAQAACEPGGRGCGGVPVHPLRLHTHRTSPAQALLTMLTEPCCNV